VGTRGGLRWRRVSAAHQPFPGAATHGYNLLEALRQFGFTPGTVDTSVVYRILREMEDGGWVSSQWDTAGSGPPRRVYTVTADGEEYLAAWINDLRCTRDEIDQFIETYTRQEAGRGSAVPGKGAGEGDHVSG
jgi:PadR family transcriptional regulator PadR